MLFLIVAISKIVANAVIGFCGYYKIFAILLFFKVCVVFHIDFFSL